MEPDAKSKARSPEMERMEELGLQLGMQATALESWAEDLLTCYPDREHAHLYVFPKLISEKLDSIFEEIYKVMREIAKGRAA